MARYVYTNKSMIYWFFVCISVISNVASSPAAAERQATYSESGSVKQKSPHHYCGLYCLYATMQLSGQEIAFSELLKPDYISRAGSSLMQLKNAAEDNGIHAKMVGKLTTKELRQSPYPIILHVKSTPDKNSYDHYELFLGSKNGQAMLFDPPYPVELVPFCELAPRCDGNGLVLSTEPINLGVIFARAQRQFIMYTAAAICVILMVHWKRKQWLLSVRNISHRQLFGLSVVQTIGLTTIALLWGFVYHFSNDEGFLAHTNATASVQKAHLVNFIPKVNKKEVEQLLNSDTVFVDARRIGDFKVGHLEGAVNIPVDANDIELRKAVADISKDSHIVVYCQSNKCPYARKVVTRLVAEGFSDISIFKGGWEEWRLGNDI